MLYFVYQILRRQKILDWLVKTYLLVPVSKVMSTIFLINILDLQQGFFQMLVVRDTQVKPYKYIIDNLGFLKYLLHYFLTTYSNVFQSVTVLINILFVFMKRNFLSTIIFLSNDHI